MCWTKEILSSKEARMAAIETGSPLWRNVRDNLEQARFELDALGGTATAYYRIDNGVMSFTSTQTPPAMRGKGAASALIRGALLEARARGLKVAAPCSFVADYLARNPEFSDLTG
jgi:predicted GNAT family acetyltransferase